ncbi:hypothetical protein K458DRAFT_480699 [Lentithecium fluviatile CBS 122367]|uniref:Cyclase n=1 Tax=Lentithecium fluviatile CBS 122367 TaxID=1168545 RepID=A0A6G1IKH1_9PLEO|nr:hypothetical protein K458DRAFT_480699 [Lentithecium fluviatile CBS 122367]
MRLDPNGDASSFPKRAHLPHIAGTPPDSAWFWGGHDELGRLNLLTPSRRRKATQENVLTGRTVSLNLPLNIPHPPLFGRKPFEHQITSLGPGAFDDSVGYNTQSSSQWDGFRHFADPKSGYFYNGATSQEILPDPDDTDAEAEGSKDGGELTVSRTLGTDAWAKHGIVGRGVLLDVYAWAEEQGRPFDPFTAYNISVLDLQACAKAYSINFQTGDILLIRTGWTQTYLSLSSTHRVTRAQLPLDQHAYAGLSASPEMKDFLYDNYFAAAASDNPSLETWPVRDVEGSLHASMLSLWGMPIGKFWDLDGLSEHCRGVGRWTFLITSCPSNVEGGVASLPNALAMF